jgi:hypothetical protein
VGIARGMSMRLIHAFALALVLTLGSFTMAVARVQAPGMTVVTVCAGTGTVDLVLDGTGQPIRGLHLCPDCIAALALAHLDAAPALYRPRTRAQEVVPLGRAGVVFRLGLRPRARGPPLGGKADLHTP